MKYQEETKNTYDQYADSYQKNAQNYLQGDLLEYMQQFIRNSPGKRILDIGSGPGRDALYLQKKGFNPICIDFSPAMVKLCQQQGLEAYEMDMQEIKLENNSFGGIWACTSLLHLSKKNISSVLEKINQLLKEKGIFFIAMKEGDFEGFKEEEKFAQSKRFFAFYTDQELRKLLSKHFEILTSSKTTRGEKVYLNYLCKKKKNDFNLLQQQYSTCKKCSKLCQSRSQVVFGSGNKKAEVLFIGEAPGANEDQQGIPFCGMSGKILNELLQSIGLSREDIFITNTILCRPENNRNPAKEEVENCRERLDQLIKIMQPKVMVTIGNFATERIIGKTGIKSIRGKIFEHQGIKVVPVVHPASYLYSGRNPEMLEQMKRDFGVIAGIVENNQKQKNLMEF